VDTSTNECCIKRSTGWTWKARSWCIYWLRRPGKWSRRRSHDVFLNPVLLASLEKYDNWALGRFRRKHSPMLSCCGLMLTSIEQLFILNVAPPVTSKHGESCVTSDGHTPSMKKLASLTEMQVHVKSGSPQDTARLAFNLVLTIGTVTEMLPEH
jgi:hypothetical protein